MPNSDFYQTLGVVPNASQDDVKKAYRKLVVLYHPDRNPDPKVADRIREINAAYDILGDPDKRRLYDRLRYGGEDRPETPSADVILAHMDGTLFQEGRKELFARLVQDVPRIKTELAVIRERAVARLGYDALKEKLLRERAAEVLEELVSPETEARRVRLIEVALEMLKGQGVCRERDESRISEIRHRLDESYRSGRVTGYQAALELFYERR